jgi:hypothetical protein
MLCEADNRLASGLNVPTVHSVSALKQATKINKQRKKLDVG